MGTSTVHPHFQTHPKFHLVDWFTKLLNDSCHHAQATAHVWWFRSPCYLHHSGTSIKSLRPCLPLLLQFSGRWNPDCVLFDWRGCWTDLGCVLPLVVCSPIWTLPIGNRSFRSCPFWEASTSSGFVSVSPCRVSSCPQPPAVTTTKRSLNSVSSSESWRSQSRAQRPKQQVSWLQSPQDPLLATRLLRLGLTGLSLWLVLHLQLQPFLEQAVDLSLVPRPLHPFLLVLSASLLQLLVWVACAVLLRKGSVELGWLDSGLRQSFKTECTHRTDQSRWKLGPGITLLCGVILWIALSFSSPAVPIGGPSAAWPIAIQSPTHSHQSWRREPTSRPRGTQESLKSDLERDGVFSLGRRSLDLREFGHSRHGHRALRAQLAGCFRDRWKYRDLRFGGYEASGWRHVGSSHRHHSSSRFGCWVRWSGRSSWPLLCHRGSIGHFGWRKYQPHRRAGQIGFGRLQPGCFRSFARSTGFRRHCLQLRSGVPVCFARTRSFVGVSKTVGGISRPGAGSCLLFGCGWHGNGAGRRSTFSASSVPCHRGPRHSSSYCGWLRQTGRFKTESQGSSTSAWRWRQAWKESREARESKETYHCVFSGKPPGSDGSYPEAQHSGPSSGNSAKADREPTGSSSFSCLSGFGSAPVTVSSRSSSGSISFGEAFEFSSKDSYGSQPWFLALPHDESATGALSVGSGKILICCKSTRRPFGEGSASSVSGTHQFGESNSSGAERSFSRLRIKFFDWYQRLCRKGQATGGIGKPTRFVLRLSDELHVPTNEPYATSGRNLPTDDGQRHLWNKIPRKIRRVRSSPRFGAGSIPCDAVDGLPAAGESLRGARQRGFASSDVGTGSDGQWQIRPGLSSLSPGRHSIQRVCKQESKRLFKVQKLLSSSGSTLDHYGVGVSERIGYHTKQAARDSRRSSSKGSAQSRRGRRRKRVSKVKGLVQEEREGKGITEPAASSWRRNRGDLDPDVDASCSVGHPLKSEIDFLTWCMCLPRWIAACRTKFSWFLKRSFRVKRCDVSLAPTTAFPLPAPDLEIFQSSGPGLSKKRLMKLARKRVLHIIVMIVNHLYLGRFPTDVEIGRRPNKLQEEVFARFRSMIAVCGSTHEKFPLAPGRSGPQLAASLFQLEAFVDCCGDLVDPYSKIPESKAFVEDPSLLPAEEFPELVPFRQLDASRLRLSGRGKCKIDEFIHGSLWLPFLEPRFLLHGLSTDSAKKPAFKFEDRNENLELAKLWDVNGLLALFDSPIMPDHFPGFFRSSNRKIETDRLVTGGFQMPENAMLEVRQKTFQRANCWLSCILKRISAFLLQSQTDVIFIIKLLFPIPEQGQICFLFHIPLNALRVPLPMRITWSVKRLPPQRNATDSSMEIVLAKFREEIQFLMARFIPLLRLYSRVTTWVLNLRFVDTKGFWLRREFWQQKDACWVTTGSPLDHFGLGLLLMISSALVLITRASPKQTLLPSELWLKHEMHMQSTRLKARVRKTSSLQTISKLREQRLILAPLPLDMAYAWLDPLSQSVLLYQPWASDRLNCQLFLQSLRPDLRAIGFR